MDYRFEYLVYMADSVIAALEGRSGRVVDTLDGATMLSAIADSVFNLESETGALHSPELYLEKLVREDLCETVDDLIHQYKSTVTFQWAGQVDDRDQLERVCRNHIEYMLYKAVHKEHMLVSDYAPTTVSVAAFSPHNVSVSFIDKHDHAIVETLMECRGGMWICLDDLTAQFYKAAKVGSVTWSPDLPTKNIKYTEDT